ncbi:MAG: Na+/H+ antiporter subunit E [Lachnospiraceae bacterium]|nr:Na+/H+ antiporter subunit E [Lachnospiraceae bacterium]
MYFVLLALWIIFNGKFTVEILVFGLLISAAVYWFMCRFLNFSPVKDRLMFRELFLFLAYVVTLLREILAANRLAFRYLMSNRIELEPVIVHFKTDLKTNTARVLLANSITLTPGTITASLIGDELYVHCLDRELAEGLDECSFVQLLRKMEALREKIL